MGNILNIIDSRNDFKKTDGQIKLQHGAFFAIDFDEHFEYKFCNLDDIDDSTNYFYVVEIMHTFGLSDTIGEMIQNNKLIDLINNDRCKVILGYEAEGDIDSEEFNDWYLEVCKPLEDKIKFTNFYIFHSQLNCEKNNKTKINFYPSIYYLETASFQLNHIIKHQEGKQLTEMGYDFEYTTIEDVDIEKKTKHFLSFMRGCHSHRIGLASYFEKNNLWFDNNISFLKVNWDYGNNPTDEVKQCLPQEYWEWVEKLDDRPIVELDTHHLEYKGGFGTIFAAKWEHYQETFLSVVSETKNDIESLYFTEKISKAIMCLHPFIMSTSPYFLKKLQQLGFKTFHPFIDESYDNEEDKIKRMQMVFDELDKFRARPIQELKDWWKEILPILEHNQKVFLKLGEGKTKRLKYMEKLND